MTTPMTTTPTSPGRDTAAAGARGRPTRRVEGIAVSTSIVAGAGASGCTSGNCSDPTNHAEGVVVSTAISAGRDGSQLNHAESVVGRSQPRADVAG
jgi:hypothetical protein